MKVAVMGFGTVGSGIAEILSQNKESVEKRAGKEISLKYILDIRDFPESPFAAYLTKNFEDIVNDPEVEVVCETIGGAKIAYDFTVRCLKAGKSVVTSNKELVATKGPELLQLAYENKVSYRYEASVGGGIPIIRSLYDSLAGNEITSVKGILNGTTNYILTKMINDGISFDTALAQAQKLGYAEQNPAADIEGTDACRKIAILSSISFGKYIDPDLVNTTGITEITLDDVAECEARNSVIKLLGIAKLGEDGRLSVRVEPTVIDENNPLSNVEGVFNAITVTGNALGDVMFYGKGAGKLPTASAVVADIIECAKSGENEKLRLWKTGDPDFVLPYSEQSAVLLLRFEDEDGSVKNAIADYAKEGSVICKNGITSFITKEMKIKEHDVKTEELKEYGKLISRFNVEK